MNYNFFEDFNTLNEFNNIQDANNDLNLFNTYEGYTHGNMFRNLYTPYKNYQPSRININSEKEEMLTNIGEYSFAMHELNLYLDIYPNDQNALNLFNKYQKQANELIMNYERKYGPINVFSNTLNNVPFNWSIAKWPWEV